MFCQPSHQQLYKPPLHIREFIRNAEVDKPLVLHQHRPLSPHAFDVAALHDEDDVCPFDHLFGHGTLGEIAQSAAVDFQVGTPAVDVRVKLIRGCDDLGEIISAPHVKSSSPEGVLYGVEVIQKLFQIPSIDPTYVHIFTSISEDFGFEIPAHFVQRARGLRTCRRQVGTEGA